MRNSLLPLVSIGIPTYNQAGLLREAILSVLQQSYRNLEILVVDDCSTDETPEVVREFDDPRIRYHRTDRNLRPPGSWNVCARLARGELFAILPHDDIYLPGFLESMVAVLQAHVRVGFAQCAYYAVDERLRPLHIRRAARIALTLSGEEAVIWQTNFYYCNPAAILFRRAVIAELGLWDEHYWDDVVLILRTAFHRGFAYTPEILSCVRAHGRNLSRVLVEERFDNVLNVINQQTALFAGILPMTPKLLRLRKQMNSSLSYSCALFAIKALARFQFRAFRLCLARAHALHSALAVDPFFYWHVTRKLCHHVLAQIQMKKKSEIPVVVLGSDASGRRLGSRTP